VGIGQGLCPDDLAEGPTQRAEVFCGQVRRQRLKMQHDPHERILRHSVLNVKCLYLYISGMALQGSSSSTPNFVNCINLP
jgi:hypothetical protein